MGSSGSVHPSDWGLHQLARVGGPVAVPDRSASVPKFRDARPPAEDAPQFNRLFWVSSTLAGHDPDKYGTSTNEPAAISRNRSCALSSWQLIRSLAGSTIKLVTTQELDALVNAECARRAPRRRLVIRYPADPIYAELIASEFAAARARSAEVRSASDVRAHGRSGLASRLQRRR